CSLRGHVYPFAQVKMSQNDLYHLRIRGTPQENNGGRTTTAQVTCENHSSTQCPVATVSDKPGASATTWQISSRLRASPISASEARAKIIPATEPSSATSAPPELPRRTSAATWYTSRSCGCGS